MNRTEMIAEVAELAVRLSLASASASPLRVSRDVVELIRISNRLHAIFERHCNGYLSDEAAERDDKAEERFRKRAALILGDYGITPKINTDPRGWPICLGEHSPSTPRVPVTR